MNKILIIFSLGLLWGCSVNGSTDSVSIKHAAEQDIVGKWAAETHCAKFGKIPKKLKTSPITTELSSLFFRTKTSVYACVDDDK